MIDYNKAQTLARQIKAVVFDVDGVLTSGVEYISSDGQIFKVRSYYDGQGVSLLRAIGLRVAFITSESSSSKSSDFIKQLIEKWNNLPSSFRVDNPDGWPLIDLYTSDDITKNKSDLLKEWLVKVELEAGDCAVMGDDLVDIPMLNLAGFKVAPIQAEEVIRQMVDFVTVRPGGNGAIRDLANFILSARNINPLDLSPK